MNTTPLPADSDTASQRVAGRCPMCGGSLELDFSDQVVCTEDTGADCPDYLAVHKLLTDEQRDHVVRIEDDRFHLKHPLRERVDDAMLSCTIHAELSARDGVIVRAGLLRGVYQVTRTDRGELSFEAFA